MEKAEYSPPVIAEEKSPYHDKMLNGAGIYPRTLWVIEFVPGKFGLNPTEPSVKSLVLPNAKHPWDKVLLEGEIEKEFIFATMTGGDLLPFKTEYLPVVLPIKKGERSWKIMTSDDLKRDGKFKMAEWLYNAQNAWETNATEKNLKGYPNAMKYVNYNNKLIKQRLDLRYYTVYTAGGTHIAAVVVDNHRLTDFIIGMTRISPNGYVPDVTTFYFGTNNSKEADYLAAILNSNVLDEKIKPYQTRGKFGPRHIHRRPFEFSIPEFDSKNELHKKIATLGAKAAREAADLPKLSRVKTKTAISSMEEIDKLVLKLLEH